MKTREVIEYEIKKSIDMAPNTAEGIKTISTLISVAQLDAILDIREILLDKVSKKPKTVETVDVETQQGPVKVLINGIPVEEGSEIL